MLQPEYKELLTILEALQDQVYIIDKNHNLVFMNSTMIENFGQGVGKKCFEVISGGSTPCSWCKAEEVFHGKTLQAEEYIERHKKTYAVIEIPLKLDEGDIFKIGIYRDITSRKKREAQIKSSEEDYRRLFKNVGCGVYISSKEGKMLDANPALVKMLGYDRKEEFLRIDIRKDLYLRPEDREKFQEMIERDSQVIDYEVDFKKKDGTPIPILLTSHVRYDSHGTVLGYEGIMVDESQRKKMERELKEAHEFLNKLIQSSPNAITVTDMQGNIMIWNEGAEETFGYKSQDVIGKMNIAGIYPPGVARKVMKAIRSPSYGGVGKLRSFPRVHVRQDGTVLDGNLSAAIIYDDEGREVASVGIFVDLGERLEMERKLRKTQEQLLQAEKLAAMGRLTSQIAHELNNPLYGIMNTLELMKTEISPSNKRRKILDMALSETERLSDLLRKMLSFSKPDQEERIATDINIVLDEILLLYAKQLQECSIKVGLDLAEGLPFVYASRNQLRQVFLNLISNARDAMPEGGLLLVKTSRKNDEVAIEFIDTGVGIRKQDLTKIFDAFFTTKDDVKDVGLGLSVCYGFIQDHGGDIKVDSEIGKGTTFTISLPIYTEQNAVASSE